MISPQDGTGRDREGDEEHEGDERPGRAEHEERGGEPFGGVAARKRVHLDAAGFDDAEVEAAPGGSPRRVDAERPRRTGLDPRQHPEAYVVGDEDDRPETAGRD